MSATLLSGFVVREAAIEDLPAIAAGLARETGRDLADVRASVDHKFQKNSEGFTGVVAADPAGRIVGHLGATHVAMNVDGERILFARIAASWIDPVYRVAGVHSPLVALDGAFSDLCRSKGLRVVFAKWSEQDWWVFRRMGRYAPIGTDSLLARAPGKLSLTSSLEVVAPREATLRAWTDPLVASACGSWRDGATTAFRLARAGRPDRALCAMRAGRVAGLAIVRTEGEVAQILDFAVPEGDEAAATSLLHAVLGDGGRRVEVTGFSRSPWFLSFQRWGFRVAPKDGGYLAISSAIPRCNAEWLAENWLAVAADVGLGPLPSLTAPEEVVTAPPMGTVSGRERHA